MILTVSQPTYFSYTGYFDLIDQGDIFCFYDDVKLEKSSWQVRNKIKSQKGELMLSVPVLCPFGRLDTNINETLLSGDRWREKHIKSIQMNYSKAKYYEDVIPWIKNLLNYGTNNLADLNMYLITMIARKIGIQSRFYKSSELEAKGKKDYRLVRMCKELKCDTYLSAPSGADYIEKNNPGGAFARKGFDLFYQNYECTEYPQLYGEFIPKLSIIDLIMNCGFDNALNLIRKGRKEMINYRLLK